MDAVLSDDCDVPFAVEFAGSVDRTQCARIRSRGDQDMFVMTMPLQKFGGQFTAAFTYAAAIHANERLYGQMRDRFADGFKCSGDPPLYQLASFGQIETDHPSHLAIPHGKSVLCENFACLYADTIVVYSEKRGVRMRNIDRDQWNLRGSNLIANNRSDFLFHLKLEYQIYTALDKLFRVLYRGHSVITVVEYDQVHTTAGRCVHQTVGDFH